MPMSGAVDPQQNLFSAQPGRFAQVAQVADGLAVGFHDHVARTQPRPGRLAVRFHAGHQHAGADLLLIAKVLQFGAGEPPVDAGAPHLLEVVLLDVEFQVPGLAVTQHRQVDLVADEYGGGLALERVHVADLTVAHPGNDVARLEAGGFRRTFRHDFHDQYAFPIVDVEGFRQFGRQVLDDDAQVAAAYLAVVDELSHDSTDHVGGNGETDSDIAPGRGEYRRIDAHQPTVQVDERTAGIARVDGGIGLNEILVPLDTQAAATERADDAAGDRLVEPERVADRHHEIADAQGVRIGKPDLRQFIRFHLQNRQVDLRIAADQRRLQQPAVGEGHIDVVGTLHDVVVGDDVSPPRIHDHAAARTAGLAIALSARNIEKAAEEGVFEEGVPHRYRGGGGNVHHGGVDPVEHGRQRRQFLAAGKFQGQCRVGGNARSRGQPQGCRNEGCSQKIAIHPCYPFAHAAIRPRIVVERETGLEPATSCLGSKGSTN